MSVRAVVRGVPVRLRLVLYRLVGHHLLDGLHRLLCLPPLQVLVLPARAHTVSSTQRLRQQSTYSGIKSSNTHQQNSLLVRLSVSVLLVRPKVSVSVSECPILLAPQRPLLPLSPLSPPPAPLAPSCPSVALPSPVLLQLEVLELLPVRLLSPPLPLSPPPAPLAPSCPSRPLPPLSRPPLTCLAAARGPSAAARAPPLAPAAPLAPSAPPPAPLASSCPSVALPSPVLLQLEAFQLLPVRLVYQFLQQFVLLLDVTLDEIVRLRDLAHRQVRILARLIRHQLLHLVRRSDGASDEQWSNGATEQRSDGATDEQRSNG